MSFTVYQLDEVSRYFPPQQSSIDKAIQDENLRKDELNALPRPSKIGLAIGIIIMLGSLFAILAAHQILPVGVNAFNQLHPGSYVIGYGLLATGFITALVSAVKWRGYNKEIERARYRSSFIREEDDYLAKIKPIQSKLADDEMLAISAKCTGLSFDHVVTNQKDYINMGYWKSFWRSAPPDETRTRQELLAGKHFITLDELRKRG